MSGHTLGPWYKKGRHVFADAEGNNRIASISIVSGL